MGVLAHYENSRADDGPKIGMHQVGPLVDVGHHRGSHLSNLDAGP